MVNRRLAVWLRPAFALVGILGLATLAGCGGGSGAPNNPYVPPPPVIPPLTILPNTINVYAGTPSTLTISGGVGPYRAFSSDQSILPIPTAVSSDTIVLVPNNVAVATPVSVTVQDSTGTVSNPAGVSVNPAPLLPSLITVTANPNPACAGTDGNLCSGGTGTASVKVTGAGGAGIPNRQVRFDVVQGNYSIVTTNPSQPTAATRTVVTDTNGNAVVVLSVPADTPTQTGVIRATDVTTGNQVTGAFQILQVTTNGAVLAVLPSGTTTINGPDNAHCSSGVTVTNYIFGGTPPYQVATNFPQAVTLSGVPVLASGGAFNTTTNGACFIGLTYVITDATGRTVTGPTVTNQLGTGAPVVAPTAMSTIPGAISKVNCVPANTFQFVTTGGTTPYSVVVTATTSSTSPSTVPQTGVVAGQAVTVSGLTSPSTTSIVVFDSSSPRQSTSVQIDCTGTGTSPVTNPLVVSPASYSYTTPLTCVNQTSNFVVTAGTPPYTVFFSSPRPGASITPGTVAASGQGFSVTGLTDGVLTTNITVSDSGTPALQRIVTITCPAAPTPVPVVVTPGTYTYFGGAACAASASKFSISGGQGPYTVFFSAPGTAGTITPTSVPGGPSPLNEFVVSGLPSTPVPRVTQMTIQDSSAVPQSTTVTVDCRTP